LTADQYDPRVGEATFFEGRVVWSIFLWMLSRTSEHVPVVADTPFNHDWNRAMFGQARAEMAVPVVEVALNGDPEALHARAHKRARQPGVHAIKATFSLNPPAYYERAYRPVLPEQQVIGLDVSDLSSVNAPDVAARVRSVLSAMRSAAGPPA